MADMQSNQTASGQTMTPELVTIKQQTTWNSLPQEIKSHILSFAGTNPPDWKDVRLVSRNWADTATPFAFEELWLTPWTLNRLEDTLSLQTIRPHVKNLVLFSAMLPIVSLKRWLEKYSEWQDRYVVHGSAFAQYHVAMTEIRRPWPPHEVDYRFERYSALFDQQERFAKYTGDWSNAASGKNLTYFEEAVQSFGRLTTVSIGDYYWHKSGLLPDPHYPLVCWSKVWKVWDDLCELRLLWINRDDNTDLGVAMPNPEYIITEDLLEQFWSHKKELKQLRLAQVYVTEDLFSAFLLKNRKNLERLELNQVRLRSARGDLGGHGWGAFLGPFCGSIRIEYIRMRSKFPPVRAPYCDPPEYLFEEFMAHDILNCGVGGGDGGILGDEEEDFLELCHALNMIHEEGGIHWAMLLDATFPHVSFASDDSGI
ncbi:MAG: hypothetical protein Q9181_005626 [Wetmoreana brouardii]